MSTYALGIMVSSEALYAVLLEKTEEGTVVQLKTSSEDLGREEADLPFEEPDEPMSGVEDEPDDVTIQFGDEGGEEDLFMGSEFEEFDSGGGEFGEGEPSGDSWNFQAQLDDLLDACAEEGYEDPEIAFCTTTAEIDEVELHLPPDESEEASEGERGLPLSASRSTLMELLEQQYEGAPAEDRVGFVPMRPSGDGRARVLALISRPGGAVLSTLSQMQNQTLARTPRASLLDTEISLYLGLARSVLKLPPDTPEKTVFVRSGPQDTLVLFIEGNTLSEFEYLPELTSEDTAETICSRVLLLQDEYGMGEVQHIMLIAEGNEDKLADAFKSYFASASLRLLRTHLPGGEEVDAAGYVPAMGAALRLLDDPDYEPFFQRVDLLPVDYTASRFRFPVGWSVPVLLVLLGVTTLGFVWYYYVNARTISQRQAELQTLQEQVAQVEPDVLEQRIDSVEAATAQYTQGLQVVDQLLQGSNKWSRELAEVTGRMNAIEGLSIDQWRSDTDTSVTLAGRSRQRERVVRLARELEGNINSLTFTETRDVSLYDFEMTVPLDTSKPAGVEYWRKQQLAAVADEESPASIADASEDTVESGGSAARTEDSDDQSSAAVTSSTSPLSDASSTETGWTVIVASLAQEGAARQVVEAYRDRIQEGDYSVRVYRSQDNGRYRVGVGEFPSFDAARSALQEIRERVPEGAWLHRFSADSEGVALSPESGRGPGVGSARS